MKLTKGKISKLYRKNKQSLKRYKKKETNKNKSFRKRGHVNLRNKSLKNYRGGQDKVDALNEKETASSSNIPDGKNKTAELLSEASDELNDGDSAVDPETLKQEQEAISQVSPELGESPKKEDLDIDSYPSDLTQEPLPEPSAQLETASNNSQNESTSPLLEKEATTESGPEQTESTQKALEEIPEVSDSQAEASPFLAEVKTEKEEGLTNVEQESTQEGGPEQTETMQEALPEVSDSQAEASPFLAEVKTEKEEGLTEVEPDQTEGAQVDGAQVDGAQTGEETGAETEGAQVDGAQVEGAQVDGAQVEGAQTGEEAQVEGAQTGEETGAQVEGAQVSEETSPAQTGEEVGPQTSAPEQSAPSTEGLPENVSIAAKTILDYAMGSLAKQINSGSTISQGVQNPESSFTNMTNTFASQGGRSLKNKIRVKGKKTRKH
jgi:hypothetical protein